MSNPATTPLFDSVDLVRRSVPGVLERVPLDQLELAPNPAHESSTEEASGASRTCSRRQGS